MAEVIGYHLIFGAYGFWLPNDPRGSWSDVVWADHLATFGGPVRVKTRKSAASSDHDARLRSAAKEHLRFPAVHFSGVQARCVAIAIGQIAQRYQLPIFAAAIMPDHVHLVVARLAQKVCRQLPPQEWIGRFKRAGSQALAKPGLHPFAEEPANHGRLRTPWAQGGWRVYLFTAEEMHRAVRYVEQNPIRQGLRPQKWSFITELKSSI